MNKFLLGNKAFVFCLRRDSSGFVVALVVSFLVVVVNLPRGVTAGLLEESVVDRGTNGVPGCLATGGLLNLNRGLLVVLEGASETSSKDSVAVSSCCVPKVSPYSF